VLPEGRTEHGLTWYLEAHGLPPDANPEEASARNKTYAGDIAREHKSFLWGAGNDRRQEWLTKSENGQTKVPLSTPEIFDWLIDLKRRFGKAIFVSFAFSYDASMALADLDFDTASTLQKGERPTEARKTISDEEYDALTDDEQEKYVEKCETIFWSPPGSARGYAIAYRKGKMFRVGRLRDPANPYKITPIKDPERKAAFEAVGLEPVDREIDYTTAGPITINDTFGFFQSSFIEAYIRRGSPHPRRGQS
jgi:hypothetical protein